MKTKASHHDSDGFLALAFHPPETFKCKVKQALSGLWHCVLVTLFIMGLPIFALAVIDYIPRIFGRCVL